MTQIKERDKSKKKAIIIKGAEDIFISMGYDLASMDKIAEQASVSKRTVYNHFGNKENLFETIVDNLLAERQTLKTIIYNSNKPLKEQLIAFAESEIFLIDSPRRLELSRFLTITFLKDLEYQKKTVARYPSMYNMLYEWMVAAKKDSKMNIDEPALAVRIFYALVIGGLTWPALFTTGFNRKAADPLLHEIIEVFLARYGNE